MQVLEGSTNSGFDFQVDMDVSAGTNEFVVEHLLALTLSSYTQS